MNKEILIERRTENSPRPYFNHPGDWRPYLIIWPEYGGQTYETWDYGALTEEMREEIRDEWGGILSGVFSDFCARYGCGITQFSANAKPGLLLKRIFDSDPWHLHHPKWTVHDFKADEAYFNEKTCYGHDTSTYLIHPANTDFRGLDFILNAPVLDRTNLLTKGTAMFELGTEESVLYMACSTPEAEAALVRMLKQQAQQYGYAIQQDTKHFLSDWIIANGAIYRQQYGADWGRF